MKLCFIPVAFFFFNRYVSMVSFIVICILKYSNLIFKWRKLVTLLITFITSFPNLTTTTKKISVSTKLLVADQIRVVEHFRLYDIYNSVDFFLDIYLECFNLCSGSVNLSRTSSKILRNLPPTWVEVGECLPSDTPFILS